jgi:hypothetical protein
MMKGRELVVVGLLHYIDREGCILSAPEQTKHLWRTTEVGMFDAIHRCCR